MVKGAFDVGRTEKDVVGYFDYAVRKEISGAGGPGATKLPVDAGKIVVGVRARVKTAFNGTTPTVKVGDAADDDGFLLTTDVDVTAANAFAASAGLGTNAYAKGRYFAAAGHILVTLAGAGMTAGALELDIVYAGFEAARRDLI